MAKLIDRLIEARWISSGRVSEGALLVEWTEEGKTAMKVIAKFRSIFCYLSPEEEFQLDWLRQHYFPEFG